MPRNTRLIGDLHRRRNLVINRVKTFETYLAQLDLENVQLGELKTRLSKTKDAWDEFENIQGQIEQSINEDVLCDAEMEARAEFETKYYAVVGRGEDVIATLIPSAAPSPAQGSFIPNPSQLAELRLPPISLPTFSGNFDEWTSFFSMFNEIVHNNNLYPESIKLKYLKASVRGEAYSLIDSLSLTAENYAIAIDLLKERYENSTRAVLKHVREIFNIPKIQKSSCSSIRSLLDTYQRHIRSLKALGEPTDSWDTILIHLITTKLDSDTYKEWQRELSAKELPKMKQLVEFLENRTQILEAISSQGANHASNTTKTHDSNRTSRSAPIDEHSKLARCLVTDNSFKPCIVCKASHLIYKCPNFEKMSFEERYSFVKANQLCLNCLKKSHRVSDCKSPYHCMTCNKNHHTLLHRNQTDSPSNSNAKAANQPHQSASSNDVQNQRHSNLPSNSVTYNTFVSQPSVVLLSTASVLVRGSNGRQLTCRALLDCGSQSSFITSAACENLKLQKLPINMSVNGFVDSSHTVFHHATAQLSSKVSKYSRNVDFLIVQKITDYVPEFKFELRNLFLPSNILLADSDLRGQGGIDMLIGADVFWDLIGQGEFKLPHLSLTLRETKLGWIFTGSTTAALVTHCHILSNVTLESLDHSIRQFWEIERVENLNTSQLLTSEEKKAEDNYIATVSRTFEGRYIVDIPLKNDTKLLGNSKEIAMRRFFSLEKRFQQDNNLKANYRKFIDEYISLGHMTEISYDKIAGSSNVYFVPHHPVFKDSSTTTKTRVVFDFSCKTSSGYSLNDISLVGPTIQPSLYAHLIRSRIYPILICGDIEKMYRQILVNPDQTCLQLILWRNSPEETLKIYRLLTVSYGNSSASWLSTRTLQQLALDHPNHITSKIIMEHFYVDDLITGCETVKEAIQIKQKISQHLLAGGFHIRKWSSNSSEFMDTIPEEDRELQSTISFDDSSVRTLGLIWLPKEDSLTFSFERFNFDGPITKRRLFSFIAKLFDPIGYLGPVVTKAKILMQELWREQYDWDEPLSSSIAKRWEAFDRTMLALKGLRISRKFIVEHCSDVELHGFSDASTVAYGACVYIRSMGADGGISTQLVTAKSRVAPLKTQSLPRLELLAAVLLIDLVQQVIPALSGIKISKILYWSDSRVVLSWINGSPSKWTTFVANRVSKIQDFSSPNQWKHVASQFNPADHISRGLYANEIVENKLWWNGPCWLSDNSLDDEIGSYNCIYDESLPDVRAPKSNILVTNTSSNAAHMINILTKYSSFDKLVRVVAYCQRFLRIPRNPKGTRPIGPIDAIAFNESKLTILRLTQAIMFSQENIDLKSGKNVKSSSPLSSLNPFLDSNKIIRVGGRLTQSSLTFDQKHPIVLLHGGTEPINMVTYIIARQIHQQNSHAGPQTLLAMMREEYWPINGRNLVRKIFHNCVSCFKAKPKTMEQLMGDLPKPRIEPSRPFYHTGLDFAGPIMIKSSMLRKAPHIKSYICLFICLSTKAIHIQLVEDLTTTSFLATLRCFISRRGKPHTIYCDNATNFVGAANELKELKDLWMAEAHKNAIIDFLANDCIKWNFIPPRSPNFGGLWESGIKLVKSHLRRIVGARIFTFNELSTVLTQIEACLNSRPLFPLTSNPNDMNSLTPAHFLIGGSLAALPEPSLLEQPDNRLKRWQLVQKTTQQFWTRWSTEYLQELQRRTKWQTSSPNIALGTLVLVKNDQAPPSAWTLGRVDALHPGPDGVVRVVTLRTASGGLYKRNVRLICPLPIAESDDFILKSLQGGENGEISAASTPNGV